MTLELHSGLVHIRRQLHGCAVRGMHSSSTAAAAAPALVPADTVGAFVSHNLVEPVRAPNPQGGPLAGLTFGLKDLYDIKGRVTGNGNPKVLEVNPPATANAAALDAVLEAGASCVGVCKAAGHRVPFCSASYPTRPHAHTHTHTLPPPPPITTTTLQVRGEEDFSESTAKLSGLCLRRVLLLHRRRQRPLRPGCQCRCTSWLPPRRLFVRLSRSRRRRPC